MLGAAEDRDSFVETAVRLGQENGCNFTLDEANEFLNAKKGDAELSEQELEAVAGGRRRPCNLGTRLTVCIIVRVLNLSELFPIGKPFDRGYYCQCESRKD